MKVSPSLLAAAGMLLTACFSATAAAVSPFTETFSSSNSLWTQNNSAAATWVASGGVGGISDGYITTTYTVPTTTSGTPVVARATGTNNASGGAFKGDYSSVSSISFYVKSDATFALPIALRLGGATPGTAITIDGGLLQPGSDWTLFTFNLSPSNYISYEGTPGADDAARFANATSNVAHLQVFFYLGEAGYVPPVTATSVTLSVDSVSVAVTPVPEPHEYALAMAALLIGLVVMRRRRAAAAH